MHTDLLVPVIRAKVQVRLLSAQARESSHCGQATESWSHSGSAGPGPAGLVVI